MKAEDNPYTPGAGMPPPELSGRDDLLESARVAFARLRNGYPTKSIIMHGLRGVGKTVLLNKALHHAEGEGVVSVYMEAGEENASLPHLMAPAMTSALNALSQKAGKGDRVAGAINFFRHFVEAFEIKLPAVGSFRMEMRDKGAMASGDLDTDLTELLKSRGRSGRRAGERHLLCLLTRFRISPRITSRL